MKYLLSEADQEFKRLVESCEFPVADFNHQAHIRLAYVYLAEHNIGYSVQLMRNTLLELLQHANIDPSQKFHETLTEAWILAVHHFMKTMASSQSSDDFIAHNPMMLNANIMMTHYSAKLLFSDTARHAFIEPDLEPIPRHGK